MSQSLNDSNETPNEPAHDRRARKRFFLKFSIDITGFDRDGNPFMERTRFEDISESGCSLNTSVPLQCGGLLGIKLTASGGKTLPKEEFQQFKVMWVIKEKARWSVGVRKLQREKAWKVSFPPPKPSLEPRSK